MTKHYSAVFIDDDELMLKAIKRTARRLIPDWHCTFINQPLNWQQAISQQTPPDIVFCDYRMPGINGAQVLDQIAEIYPLAIRILMTGDTRDEVLLGNCGNAHSLVNKPFSDDLLADLLSQVAKLNALPINHQQQECLGQLSHLPVLPEVITQLREALNNEQNSIADIADIISQEPLIAARIIQVANSAYLGFQRTTESLDEAIGRLGLQLLHALTISFAIESETAPLMPARLHQKVCDDTHQIALLSKQFAKAMGASAKCQEQVFTAAVLNGTGRLVLAITAQKSPDLYRQLQKESAYPDILITGFLLTLWCFPQDIIAALLTIDTAPTSDDSAWINVLYYVYHYQQNKDDKEALAGYLDTLPTAVKSALLTTVG